MEVEERKSGDDGPALVSKPIRENGTQKVEKIVSRRGRARVGGRGRGRGRALGPVAGRGRGRGAALLTPAGVSSTKPAILGDQGTVPLPVSELPGRLERDGGLPPTSVEVEGRSPGGPAASVERSQVVAVGALQDAWLAEEKAFDTDSVVLG